MPHTRKDIKCSELRELYIRKHLSLFRIGGILGYSARTVEIRTKECKIQLRNPGPVPPKITDKTLKNLYLKKKLSSRKIAKIYGCAYSHIDSRIILLGVPRRNLATSHITTKRSNFSGNLEEKAYLIGFSIGDLRVRKIYKNSETILVDCGSTKPEQIKLIKILFQKYGRVWISKPKLNGKVQIESSLNKSFCFLLKKYNRFPTWIEANNTLKMFALAGFVDAEGSFFIENSRKHSIFSIGNYNQEILKQINEWLTGFGFKTRLFMGAKKGYRGKDGYTHNKDYWILSISKKSDLYLFTKKMLPYLRHKDRITKAREVLENINQRNTKYGFIGM